MIQNGYSTKLNLGVSAFQPIYKWFTIMQEISWLYADDTVICQKKIISSETNKINKQNRGRMPMAQI